MDSVVHNLLSVPFLCFCWLVLLVVLVVRFDLHDFQASSRGCSMGVDDHHFSSRVAAVVEYEVHISKQSCEFDRVVVSGHMPYCLGHNASVCVL